MLTGILVTDGGPHSPGDWAYASASMLLEALKVDPNSPRRIQLEMEKDRLRPQIAQILLGHHTGVQTKEREILQAGQHERLMDPLDPTEHVDVDQAVADIHALMAPLMQQSLLFAAGEVTADPAETDKHLTYLIRERVEMDLRTNMHIERSWHADRNPENLHAQVFKGVFHGTRPEGVVVGAKSEIIKTGAK
jgi:hypothetical protein